ncbi:hypothetical protein ABPG74_010744 [Tetrahymena malaccensis]
MMQLNQEQVNNFYSLEYLNSQLNNDLKAKTTETEYQNIQNILEVLNNDIVDVAKLREYANLGISDHCIGLRALVWKILLEYFKPDRSTWSKQLQDSRVYYNQFLDDFLRKQKLPPQNVIDEHEEEELKKKQESNTSQNETNNLSIKIQESDPFFIKNSKTNPPNRLSQGNSQNKMKFQKVVDHPLSKCSKSNWNSFFQDSELFTQIEKDTERTRADMHFFTSHTQREVRLQIPFITQIRQEKKKKNISQEERHCDVLSRILFIYAKLNQGIQYVQGMNEVLAPIYYVFQNERAFPLFQEEGFLQIEADTFFCFIKVMGFLKDRFMRQMDECQQGIKKQCQEFNSYLKAYDNDLWFHFQKLQIDPQYYSLRWLLLLYTQEFQLNDVTRLWDTLLSRKNILTYAFYIGLAILQINRTLFLDEDFAIVMTSLQKIEKMNILQIISEARNIEQKHINKQSYQDSEGSV